jgi:serine/threonine protein kinase
MISILILDLDKVHFEIFKINIHDFVYSAYIVMELGGENLLTLINRLRKMSRNAGASIDPVMIKEFWRQMVSIVGTLHAHSIVHMDLKPANLILFGQILKIADLGISRKADSLA